MLILTIKTDNPEARIALYDDQTLLAEETWQGHRQLAETIHQKIEGLLKRQQKDWSDITGICCFQGPGSFTGLRIGLTVANALAYANHIPIVSTQHHGWEQTGITRLLAGENEQVALPEYGAPAHITEARK